ncbi:XRE family transcriptional regulator [Streptomyces diacarni]|uniref:XRE family transcriptional regulator n=1 Tax=Streptomyces diacarni TaxID=2800381 RepID=UPI0033E327A8
MTAFTLRRKADGQPLRDAMRDAGLSGPALADATKRVDVTGRGISAATVGKLAGRGDSCTSTCRLRTAWLIAESLGASMQRLFDMPGVSTDTVER